MTDSDNKNDSSRLGDHHLLRERDHDPYHSKHKLKEPTVCSDCGAVFQAGRWTWKDAPSGAHKGVCPACHRIRDKVPAGFLTISGGFYANHKEEILGLIRNIEEREKKEHPLKRIMGSEDQQDGVVFTFTDAHLARGAGVALHHAYEGDLDFQYTDEDIMLRVKWVR